MIQSLFFWAQSQKTTSTWCRPLVVSHSRLRELHLLVNSVPSALSTDRRKARQLENTRDEHRARQVHGIRQVLILCCICTRRCVIAAYSHQQSDEDYLSLVREPLKVQSISIVDDTCTF